ncbi:5242_t:CDS:1, partial [Acaulospora morrowiae]
PKSSSTASSSITPSPCLSTGQKLTLSSCADTTNYYCNTTTSMCVPKQADNASCTDNLMCNVNSACQNLVCVPLASNGSGGVNVGKVGIIAGVIAGIFVLAGIAFWAYGFLAKRKENRRRMEEPYESKTNSRFEPSTDYPFISRPNSFSNSNAPPPAVTRPDMRAFGGAPNNNAYGRPPPTVQYNQQLNNYTEFENTNVDRSSKYNYLSTAFTKMRLSMGYGINNSQPESANGPLPFTANNESRMGANPQMQGNNDFNVATHDVKYPLGNVEEEDLEENITLRDSSVLPADDQDVFSLVSESPYLGLERNNSSASQEGDRRRYKM